MKSDAVPRSSRDAAKWFHASKIFATFAVKDV
jgi:hypothetical protein